MRGRKRLCESASDDSVTKREETNHPHSERSMSQTQSTTTISNNPNNKKTRPRSRQRETHLTRSKRRRRRKNDRNREKKRNKRREYQIASFVCRSESSRVQIIKEIEREANTRVVRQTKGRKKKKKKKKRKSHIHPVTTQHLHPSFPSTLRASGLT